MTEGAGDYQKAKMRLVQTMYSPSVRRRCRAILELAFTNTADKVKLLQDLDLAREIIGDLVDAELAEQTRKASER